MRVVAAFHARNSQGHLWRKLNTLDWCHKVVVVFDGEPNRWERLICDGHDNIDLLVRPRAPGVAPRNEHGDVMCPEGLLRQMAWDRAASYEPDWVILGDVDETLTEGAREFILRADPDVDVFYLRIANLVTDEAVLWHDVRRSQYAMWPRLYYVAGPDAAYSLERCDANLRGSLCRWRPGVEYKYDLSMTAHCRAEPNPVSPRKGVVDKKHVITEDVKVLHWKWVNWERWLVNPQRKSEKQRRYWRKVEFKPAPDEWFSPDFEPERERGFWCARCGGEAWGPLTQTAYGEVLMRCLICGWGVCDPYAH